MIELSFYVQKIEYNQGNEIIYLDLFDGSRCRLMMFHEKQTGQNAIVYDVIKSDSASIFKRDKVFFNGSMLGADLLDNNFITQWEIIVIDSIAYALIHSDVEYFLELIQKYNINIGRDVEWYIRNNLGKKRKNN